MYGLARDFVAPAVTSPAPKNACGAVPALESRAPCWTEETRERDVGDNLGRSTLGFVSRLLTLHLLHDGVPSIPMVVAVGDAVLFAPVEPTALLDKHFCVHF